jgi:hypothetical protein
MMRTFSQKQNQLQQQTFFNPTKLGLASLTMRHDTLSRKASDSPVTHDRSSSLLLVNKVLHSPGKPLDSETRAFIEPSFYHDFSKVRVHTDEPASESAKAIGALAYTVGHHIAFAPGQYAPNTRTGLHLLSHELAHVVQQSGATIHDRFVLGERGSQYEREADQTAKEACARREDGIGRMQAEPISALSTTTSTTRYKLHQKTQPQNYSLIQRQPSGDDDLDRKVPPDWQHGAPTKPVSPDPHVAPAPGTKPELKETEYRGPQPAKETEEKQELSTREKIANALKRAGVPSWAVAAMVVLVIAALADPEPFTKVALLIGAAAAVVVFAALGRYSSAPPSV